MQLDLLLGSAKGYVGSTCISLCGWEGVRERERERESLHLSSHTGLMQVLPGHPLADTITECSITV